MRITIIDSRQFIGRYSSDLFCKYDMIPVCGWRLLDTAPALTRSLKYEVGQSKSLCRFLAFDRHFNLVLADTEEYRKLPPKKGKSEAEVISS